jgi:hypothetical protein
MNGPQSGIAEAPGRSSQPIWRTWTARVQEDKKHAYHHMVETWYRAKLEAWLAAGLITDYKVLVVEPHGVDDPNVIFMYQHSAMADLDVDGSEWDRIAAEATERFKDDMELQEAISAYHDWRTFTGWRPLAKELVGRAQVPPREPVAPRNDAGRGEDGRGAGDNL